MMKEILAPILESELLSEDVKESIERSLEESLVKYGEKIKKEVEEQAKENFEKAKAKFEESYKTLEETYKSKLTESQKTIDEMVSDIKILEENIEALKSNPFINLSEEDLEDAEQTLIEKVKTEMQNEHKKELQQLANEIELINEAKELGVKNLIEIMNKNIQSMELDKENLLTQIEYLEIEKDELKNQLKEQKSMEIEIANAIKEKEKEIKAEYNKKLKETKEHLASATEIFLEQEISELKESYKEMIKEQTGRELLENLKNIIKEYWDIDEEVSKDLLNLKKEYSLKVEQYKEMLKKEHERLEEMKNENEDLKKKLIIESKASILTSDKKAKLEKLTESLDVESVETNIDKLLETVVDEFNNGFEKEIKKETVKKEEVLTESNGIISSGDVKKTSKNNIDLSDIMELAGIK